MTISFTQLGIRNELADTLRDSGMVNPTPVQERAIPIILKGRDVIVQAQTGTGKTLAFVLPILQNINPHADYVQALIVTPTRELAIQITAEVKKLKDAVGARVLAAYGGQDVTAQIHKLREAPNIIIATPGRLLDHLRRGTVQLDRLSMLILDEADQMLHMGFLKEVEEIIAETPSDRQTMLFSATMPDNVKRLAANYMRDPQDIHVQGKRITLEGIEQVIIQTTDRAKQETLISMLEHYQPYLAVIFCRTKIRAKKLTEALAAYGFNVDELHGDLTQAKREQVMKRFRDARLQILVATDVAARGLDVEGVTHVFNYDIPHDAESYIHRIGRTGRAGHTGCAFTFAAPRDEEFVQQIQREIGLKLERREMDTGNSENEFSEGRSGISAKPRNRESRNGRDSGGSRDGKGRAAVGARAGGERSSARSARAQGGERGTSRGAAGRNGELPKGKPVSGYSQARVAPSNDGRRDKSSRGTVLASARLSKSSDIERTAIMDNSPTERKAKAMPVSGYSLASNKKQRTGIGGGSSRGTARSEMKPTSGPASRSNEKTEWFNNKQDAGKQRHKQSPVGSSRGRKTGSPRKSK